MFIGVSKFMCEPRLNRYCIVLRLESLRSEFGHVTYCVTEPDPSLFEFSHFQRRNALNYMYAFQVSWEI